MTTADSPRLTAKIEFELPETREEALVRFVDASNELLADVSEAIENHYPESD